jgi:NAD(P)-dependent dehydrogenase (short-subunit alcohol dehydrogenase family)
MGIDIDVKDRVAMITGGARGIGLTIAKEFLEHGACVHLVDLDPTGEPVDQLHRSGSLHVHRGDVTMPASIQACVDEIVRVSGRIDILVNCAGVINKDLVENLNVAAWQRVMDINVTGTMLAARAVVPIMKEKRWGRIINISSMQALMGTPQYSAYTASKAAVIGLTRVWAMELVSYNITVNDLCPSFVRTPLLERAVETLGQTEGISLEEAKERFVGLVPQRRFLEPEEIAFAALFLSSKWAQGITGSSIAIAAGCVLY